MEHWVQPVVLEGEHVRIEPLEPNHAPGLFEIGREPSIWQWLFRGPFTNLEDAEGYIRNVVSAREGGGEFGFVVIHRDSGRVAGTTRYLNIRPQDRAIEIGWTWYGAEFQRTGVNTECKLLLMEHAFEKLGANRVQLKTDSRNVRSQAAIARLGAIREGILRQDTVVGKDGYIRDTVYFSVVRAEWPRVKIRLVGLLSAKSPAKGSDLP